MLANALADLPLHALDLLLIENVGNLICPAAFALGEHRNVLIASVPEGDDKPYKYPVMFGQADLVALNKIDLLAHVAFTRERFTEAVRGINDAAPIIELSCRSGDRVDGWTEWLLAQMKDAKSV